MTVINKSFFFFSCCWFVGLVQCAVDLTIYVHFCPRVTLSWNADRARGIHTIRTYVCILCFFSLPNYVTTSQEKVIFLQCCSFQAFIYVRILLVVCVYLYILNSAYERSATGHYECKCEWNESVGLCLLFKIVFKITIIVVNVDFNIKTFSLKLGCSFGL